MPLVKWVYLEQVDEVFRSIYCHAMSKIFIVNLAVIRSPQSRGYCCLL